MYAAYFDQQYEMIRAIVPRVVGQSLDIVRIFDPDYRSRVLKPMIWKKILRNLKLVKQFNLILSLTCAPCRGGETSPTCRHPF